MKKSAFILLCAALLSACTSAPSEIHTVEDEHDPNPPASEICTLRYNGKIYSSRFTSGMFCVAGNTVIDVHNQPLYSHTGESYTSVGILDIFPEYLSTESAGIMKATHKEIPENDFETTQSLSQFSGLGCDFHDTLLYVVDDETVITVTPCDNLSGKTAETDADVPFYSYIMYRLEDSDPIEQSEEATTGIPARLIMLDGVIYYIESITPTDYVVFTDGEYISVCHGGASEFSELLSAENYIGDIIRTEGMPQADFESDFYLDAKVYSDGESAVLLAEYPEYARYVQVHENIDKNSFAMDDILYVYPVNTELIVNH